MSTLEELLEYCRTKIKEYPDLRGDIIEEYQMADAEVHDGESESHEVEKAIDSIDEMIEEYHDFSEEG